MEAAITFQHLKTTLTSACVMALSNFSQPFELEADTSERLSYKNVDQSSSYIGSSLPSYAYLKIIYERQLMAIVLIILKWHSFFSAKNLLIL